MGRGDIVNTLIEITDTYHVARFGDESRDVLNELAFRGLTSGIVEQIECSPVMCGVVGEHIQTRAPKMRLGAAIMMQDIIIDLTCTIEVRKMN